MNRPWKTSGLLLLVFGLGCFCRLPATLADTPRISTGFNGYVKPLRWFPVLIEPFPEHTLQHVALMQRGRGEAPATMVRKFGVERDPETGGWRVLAWLPRGYRDEEAYLECLFFSDTGQLRTVNVSFRNLAMDDLLVLAVSDRPAEFDFMGSIEHGRQQITRAVAGGPEMLRGLRRQDLQVIDMIVLDGPAPSQDNDRRVLRHWVIMGGTVLLTDRAMLHEDADWGFLEASLPELATIETVTGNEAAALFDDNAPRVFAMPFVNAIPENFVPLVTCRSGTLVGARELGQGRILVSAVDWTAMELRDRALYAPARRTFWSELFRLRRRPALPGLPHHVSIPREAQVRFLMGPLLWFLLGCCLLLGPFNWLMLRWFRRHEYMMVTLPAGAALLALGAIVAGHTWRPRDIVIHEISATFDNGHVAWRDGISGILSPGFRIYSVTTPNPETLLHKIPFPGDTLHAPDKKSPPSITTLGQDGMHIDGVPIERWSMRFFATDRPVDDSNGLRAEAEITATNRLSGTLHNRSPFAVRDVWVISDADRVLLGDIAPGATHPFELILRDPRDDPERQCPGCGRYHLKADPFDERDGDPPIPPGIKSLGSHWLAERHRGPYAVGITDADTPVLDVIQPEMPIQRRTVNIITAPIAIQWSEASPVPRRFVHRMTVPDAYDRDTWDTRLRQLPLQYLPHGLAVKTAFQRSATALKPGAETRQAPGSAGHRCRTIFFALPTIHDSSVIRIEWDRQFPAADQPADYGIILETFDWERDRWTALGSATNGLQQFTMTGADGAVLKPTPGISVRERPAESSTRAPATRDRFRQGILTVEVLHGDAVIDR